MFSEAKLLTLDEVAECLGVSGRSVRRWVRDGVFPVPTVSFDGLKGSRVTVSAMRTWVRRTGSRPRMTANEKAIDRKLRGL